MTDSIEVKDFSDLNTQATAEDVTAMARYHKGLGEGFASFKETLTGLGYPLDDLHEKAAVVWQMLEIIDHPTPTPGPHRARSERHMLIAAEALATGINGIRRTARLAQQRVRNA